MCIRDSIESGQAAVGAYCKDIEAGKKFMENTFKLGDSGKVYDCLLYTSASVLRSSRGLAT